MLLKSSTRRPQLVGRVGDDAHVELAGRDLPRRAREPRDRIGDAAGDRRAESRREQHDEHRADEHAAVELVDLALDLALARARAARSARRRGRAPAPAPPRRDTGTSPSRSSRDERRQPIERDRAVHRGRRARRAADPSRTGRAGSSRRSSRSLEQVHVLIDHLPDPDHHVVGRRGQRLIRTLLGGREFLEHAAGDGHDARWLRTRRRRGTSSSCRRRTRARTAAPGRSPRARRTGTACGRSSCGSRAKSTRSGASCRCARTARRRVAPIRTARQKDGRHERRRLGQPRRRARTASAPDSRARRCRRDRCAKYTLIRAIARRRSVVQNGSRERVEPIGQRPCVIGHATRPDVNTRMQAPAVDDDLEIGDARSARRRRRGRPRTS